MTNFDIDARRLLPLPPAVFHILIALGEGEKHGYAVMQEVADRTAGQVRMSPGTLYGSKRKMLDCRPMAECCPGTHEPRHALRLEPQDARRRAHRGIGPARADGELEGRSPSNERRRAAPLLPADQIRPRGRRGGGGAARRAAPSRAAQRAPAAPELNEAPSPLPAP